MASASTASPPPEDAMHRERAARLDARREALALTYTALAERIGKSINAVHATLKANQTGLTMRRGRLLDAIERALDSAESEK